MARAPYPYPTGGGRRYGGLVSTRQNERDSYTTYDINKEPPHGGCSEKHSNLDGAADCLLAYEFSRHFKGKTSTRAICGVVRGKGPRPLNAEEKALLVTLLQGTRYTTLERRDSGFVLGCTHMHADLEDLAECVDRHRALCAERGEPDRREVFAVDEHNETRALSVAEQTALDALLGVLSDR